MKAPHKYVQWAIISALFGIGIIAFFVAAGEDDPANPLSFGDWLMVKGGAVAVVYACYRVGRYLHSLGLLPVADADLTKEEDYYE